IDIPECETWLWCNDGAENRDFGKFPTYTNINKYVSSAAHLEGKKIVSCEEGTNLGAVFNMTMERMKVTCDQSNLSGVTHSVLCGFNYSPIEAPFPGWVRYGMYLNDQNTWWPYFKLFAAYKTRLSVILQETEAFADIAILHPLADMWTIHGPQRDPFPRLRYPEYQYRVWEGIHKNGNGCDYISESVMQQSAMGNGWMKYKNRTYNTIMLLEVETMMPATADALLQFVKKGGKVIFVGKEPCKSSGLRDYKKNDKKVAQAVAAMKRANPSQVFTVKAPADDMIDWFGNIQKQCDIRPYMKIDRPVTYISQIRHQADGKDIFFVSNCSTDDRYKIQATFPESKGKPFLWDLETGERYHYPAASGNTLTIDLPPAHTQLIVFDTKSEGLDYPALPVEKPGKELSPWHLRMEHINGTTQERAIQSLLDLSTDEQTRSFAGYLTYEKKLEGDISSFNWLDLGKVFGVSEVSLNGENLGCRWYGRHLYRIPEHSAKADEKILRIKITTTLGNYFKSNPENKVGYGWTRNQTWQPVGMLGPVKLL
ncbi:MAG: glycoside hydrolase family 2, partial [Bacteroidales bacterium]|nr:glycoside hydrolase family 2 [Bacteroidales bacterium]